MSTNQVTAPESSTVPQRISLPLLQERINEELQRQRQRLLKEAGLNQPPPAHYKRPLERSFTRAEREHVTILFGGLTLRHDELLLAGLRGLGYKVARLPIPNKKDFQAGKEYGNNGQCNPTYFTVGNLVNYLKDLRDKHGIPAEEITRDYLFVTAGACGPCRFGMYEAEYRLALRNSGFDGFRVLLFDQSAGMDQTGEAGGLELNLSFSLMFLNSLFMGDLLNEVAYQIRPYEVVAGSTNAAFGECLRICQDALESKDFAATRGGILSRFFSRRLPLNGPDDLAKVLDQLYGRTFIKALQACRDLINERVEVDFTRCKPTVKVTGEFWAQTTEGDGNFRMFNFLEGEGVQVLVEPVVTWVGYLLHCTITQFMAKRGLTDNEKPAPKWDLLGRFRHAWRYRTQLFWYKLAAALLDREYERLRLGLGGTAHGAVDQQELQRLGSPYYDSRAEGGEGHMEVAKNIYYAHHKLAHMVLSLKPFGCMPSTQSDGAQAAVVSHYPDMIFLPIETSGEGDINAYSRAQMALGEAKVKAKTEFQQVVQGTGYRLEQMQKFVAEHRELRRPMQPIPHQHGIIGHGANFLLHVAAQMRSAGISS